MTTSDSLRLGTLVELAQTEGVDTPYWFEAMARGTEWGAPEAVTKIVTALLSDGDLVQYDRAGNREVTIRVRVNVQADAENAGAHLAQGEAALARELGKANTITWTPPPTWGPPTVFDVLTSSMKLVMDRKAEVFGQRVYEITLTCAPHARSAEAVTIPAMAPPAAVPTEATVNNADSTTGWSATISTYSIDGPSAPVALTVTDQGTYVRAQGTGTWPSVQIVLAVAATDMTTTPYLQVEMSGDAPSVFVLTFDGGSSAVTVSPIVTRATAAGTTLYVFDASGHDDLSGFKAGRSKFYAPSAETVTLNVHDVKRTDTLPQVSARQISRTLEVGGTERTPASIRVSSPDGVTPMTLAIAHTCTEKRVGYSPPLRRWKVDGSATTPDPFIFSGESEPIKLDPGFVAHVPTSTLPEATYLLAATLRCGTAGSYPVSWSTATLFPDAVTIEGYELEQETVEFPGAGWWVLASLGVVRLPSVRTTSGWARVAIQQTNPADPTIDLDEGWLFHMSDDSALSIVNAVGEPFMWLDSPDVSSPVERVWVGNEADRSDAHHPGTALISQGRHVLHPEGTAIFTAARNVDYPEASATYYKRWHSNAAE